MKTPNDSTPTFDANTPVPWTPPPRPANREFSSLAVYMGKTSGWYTDLYAFLLRIGWMRLLALHATLYLSLNAIFATIYVSLGSCIKGARPDHWGDAFFFSVQTLSTIGYGGMTPAGMVGNFLVTLESMLGLIGIALATGLVFAKFARPTARVLFSRVAVINQHNGVPSLKFRLANERDTKIVEASIRVTVLLDEVTQEGQALRRLHDLKVVRNFTPIFLLSWLVVHPIDEDSPIYGMSLEELKRQDARIIITMTGIDGLFSQTIHAYHVYWAEDLMEGVRFVDVLEPLPSQEILLHFHKFHDIYPEPKIPASLK